MTVTILILLAFFLGALCGHEDAMHCSCREERKRKREPCQRYKEQ